MTLRLANLCCCWLLERWEPALCLFVIWWFPLGGRDDLSCWVTVEWSERKDWFSSSLGCWWLFIKSTGEVDEDVVIWWPFHRGVMLLSLTDPLDIIIPFPCNKKIPLYKTYIDLISFNGRMIELLVSIPNRNWADVRFRSETGLSGAFNTRSTSLLI